MIVISGLENDIPLQTAIRAFDGVSFSSERRGGAVVSKYVKVLTALAEHITEHARGDRQKAIAQEVFDKLRDKYRTKSLNWLGAQSRCFSTMIAGPANFPVHRAEKANRSEHNRMIELSAFEKAMFRYAEKSLSYVMPKESVLDSASAQLKTAERYQVFMKAANDLYRKNELDELKSLFVTFYANESEAIHNYNKRFVVPNCFGAFGFEGFELTSNNNRIKVLTVKVVTFEKAATAEQKLNGLEIVRNLQEDRLQLLFAGKPEDEERALLKSNGFKWSPRFKAWQRQLTANAEVVLTHRILKNPLFAKYNQPEA